MRKRGRQVVGGEAEGKGRALWRGQREKVGSWGEEVGIVGSGSEERGW